MIQLVNIVLTVVSLALLLAALYLFRKAYFLYKAIREKISAEKRVKKLRKRYVVFAAVCEEKVGHNDVASALRDTFVKLYGELTTQKGSPRVLIFDEEKQRGIARISHLHVDLLVASLGFIKRVGSTKCILIPLKVTGTIKKARKYLDTLKL